MSVRQTWVRRGYPEELEADDVEEEEQGPEESDADLRAPKNGRPGVRSFGLEVVVLEEVYLVAVLVRDRPPAQTHQHAPGHVLDRPEVHDDQDRDQQESQHAVFAREEVDRCLEELEDAVERHRGTACVRVFWGPRDRVFGAVSGGL